MASRQILLTAAAALAVLPITSFAAEYEADPVHSNASFTVRHMMLTNVRGEFTTLAAVLDLNEKDITRSKVEATIDANTIDTRNAKRDQHLRSADFFYVEKHPKLTFKSKKVQKAGKDKLKVTGDLTIRGVTREVVLDVEGLTKPIKDPFGGTRIGALATTKINRKDFGLNWNQALEAGGVLVSDEVKIALDLQFVQKQPAAPAGQK